MQKKKGGKYCLAVIVVFVGLLLVFSRSIVE